VVFLDKQEARLLLLYLMHLSDGPKSPEFSMEIPFTTA